MQHGTLIIASDCLHKYQFPIQIRIERLSAGYFMSDYSPQWQHPPDGKSKDVTGINWLFCYIHSKVHLISTILVTNLLFSRETVVEVQAWIIIPYNFMSMWFHIHAQKCSFI